MLWVAMGWDGMGWDARNSGAILCKASAEGGGA
jgi:hypothetical protein